jgi:hypothetical protein
MTKPLVIIESPYAGDLQRNIQYAIRAMYDSILNHAEAPIAFHLLYPQILRDSNPEERQLGLNLSQLWYPHADRVIMYIDYGVSPGMNFGKVKAMSMGLPVTMRRIGPNPANDEIMTGYM